MRAKAIVSGDIDYQSEDVLGLARQLLGKTLVTSIDGKICGGIIAETEAYRAPDDRACHAYGNKITPRTKTMFGRGGTAYIYLCYGIHHLFNVVTGPEGTAHAVLIRALIPQEGIEFMLERRKHKQLNYKLTRGPGALSVALGIHTKMNGTHLLTSNSAIRILNTGLHLSTEDISQSPRIGVGYAGESALLPWRFYVKNCPWVSG
jgi:DNA-3-methyladenine glycosylase